MRIVRWGVKWVSKDNPHLVCEMRMPVLFRTRSEARWWIETKFGYIKHRNDLRKPPHCWRMPVAVRVSVEAIS